MFHKSARDNTASISSCQVEVELTHRFFTPESLPLPFQSLIFTMSQRTLRSMSFGKNGASNSTVAGRRLQGSKPSSSNTQGLHSKGKPKDKRNEEVLAYFFFYYCYSRFLLYVVIHRHFEARQ